LPLENQGKLLPAITEIKQSGKFKLLKMAIPTLQPVKAKKVLIIEDEGDMCLLLNIILNGKEMELDHVKDLSAAEEYLQKENPSVVILDNKLPDGFGVDFILLLKKNYPSVKIIMISGFDGAAKDVALHNGADIYLEKPFSKDQLYEALKGLMQ
jgi:DNA-binding response OmpR family regulator